MEGSFCHLFLPPCSFFPLTASSSSSSSTPVRPSVLPLPSHCSPSFVSPLLESTHTVSSSTPPPFTSYSLSFSSFLFYRIFLFLFLPPPRPRSRPRRHHFPATNVRPIRRFRLLRLSANSILTSPKQLPFFFLSLSIPVPSACSSVRLSVPLLRALFCRDYVET